MSEKVLEAVVTAAIESTQVSYPTSGLKERF
jgi:hypothetical protein